MNKQMKPKAILLLSIAILGTIGESAVKISSLLRRVDFDKIIQDFLAQIFRFCS